MSTSQPDYEKVIVKKPWGYEYVMYQNGIVGLWYLSIEPGKRTSMHCHPRKKTGLVLLSGQAVVSFLNDSVTLRPIAKLMIRAGLFHSTAAVSPEGVALIEVETPYDKGNLVRLEDEYGRREQAYEGPEAFMPMTESTLRLSHPVEGSEFKHKMHGCVLATERVKDVGGLRKRDPGEIIVVLDGGLFSRTEEPVLGPGDVVSTATLDRLAAAFPAPRGISLLAISKES